MKDIEEILRLIKSSVDSGDKPRKDHGNPQSVPKIIQHNLLKDYKEVMGNSNGLKAGDLVKRNYFGEMRYRFPIDGMACMISRVFDKPMLDDSGHLVDGEISYIGAHEELQANCVRLSHYEKVKSKIKSKAKK